MSASDGAQAGRAPGAMLAEERERQGLSRADAAQRLRMSTSQVEAPVILPLPVEAPAPVLVMASAARATEAPAATTAPNCDLWDALAQQGTVRAAARALGIAESTFRGRCRRAGVPLPGRKAKG